jgi:hypothetical protein
VCGTCSENYYTCDTCKEGLNRNGPGTCSCKDGFTDYDLNLDCE